MTRRPSEGSQGGAGDRGTVEADSTGPACHCRCPDAADTRLVVRAIVAPIVSTARRHGPLPKFGSRAWHDAPRIVQLAVLLVVSEGWSFYDPDAHVRRRLREMSHDLAGAADWSRIARRPTRAELERRRGEVA